MINRRKKAFERRQARYASVKELMNDIRAEASFEEGLQRELPREQKFEGEFVKPGFWRTSPSPFFRFRVCGA